MDADNLKRLTQCAVCRGPYRSPRSLSCHHSFCTECLLDMRQGRGRVTCPDCRKVRRVSSVHALPVNRQLESITAEVRAGRRGGGLCGLCGQAARGPTFCCDCNLPLCAPCGGQHSALPGLAAHVLKPCRAEAGVCEQHAALLQLYCEACERAMCTFCMLEAHRGHATVSVTEKVRQCRTDVEDILCEVTTKLAALGDLEDYTKMEAFYTKCDVQLRALHWQLEAEKTRLAAGRELWGTQRARRQQGADLCERYRVDLRALAGQTEDPHAFLSRYSALRGQLSDMQASLQDMPVRPAAPVMLRVKTPESLARLLGRDLTSPVDALIPGGGSRDTGPAVTTSSKAMGYSMGQPTSTNTGQDASNSTEKTASHGMGHATNNGKAGMTTSNSAAGMTTSNSAAGMTTSNSAAGMTTSNSAAGMTTRNSSKCSVSRRVGPTTSHLVHKTKKNRRRFNKISRPTWTYSSTHTAGGMQNGVVTLKRSQETHDWTVVKREVLDAETMELNRPVVPRHPRAAPARLPLEIIDLIDSDDDC